MESRYLVGLPIANIPTPALIIDIDILEQNMTKMKEYLSRTGVKLRPHTKTHKTPTIGHMQIQAGAIGLCCATVGEAEEMVCAGLDNIFIANEVIGEDKIRRVTSLARFANVMVAIDNEENLVQLSLEACVKGIELGVLIDIDVGMGRCGVRSIEHAIELAKKAKELNGIRFCGLMGYEGHAVSIEDREERVKACRTANKILVDTVKAIEEVGISVEIVSAGGTGTYDITAEFPGITEIEAGSYIFMDGTYEKLGLPFEQSLTVLTTVLSRPEKDVIIMDAGIKGISAEREMPRVRDDESVKIEKLSEEHAKGKLTSSIRKYQTGDKVHLIPSHCCSTVNLYDKMYIVKGNRIEAIWPITARGAY